MVLSAAAQGSGPSPEERQRFIMVVRQLEQSPLDKGLQREGDRKMEWVMRVPGAHMKICGRALREFYQERPEYKYHERIISQLMLASAAFVFEHPDRADDEMADYTASMESALKVYSAILKSKPDTRSKALDELVQISGEGKLESHVRKQCDSGVQSSETQAPTPTVAQQPVEKHTTPEERQRLVVVAHKLEEAPLDPALNSDREWALQWVIRAPDVRVRLCTNLLAGLRRPNHKYRSELANQLLISSAAFLIEHPEQADGIVDQSVGGMEGVLKAYSAILKTDPQATAKSLDDLAQKQRDGKLAEAVREIVKDCR